MKTFYGYGTGYGYILICRMSSSIDSFGSDCLLCLSMRDLRSLLRLLSLTKRCESVLSLSGLIFDRLLCCCDVISNIMLSDVFEGQPMIGEAEKKFSRVNCDETV